MEQGQTSPSPSKGEDVRSSNKKTYNYHVIRHIIIGNGNETKTK